MDNLANGLATAHHHGMSTGSWIAIFVAVWVPIFFAGTAGRRRQKKQDVETTCLAPKPRAPIPGTEKDYRR
jgi:hypothetical protein